MRTRKIERLIHCAFVMTALCTISGASAGESAYRAPRTADGKPDLQGVWTNASITTLQRNSRYKKLVLSKDEVAAATAAHPQVVRLKTDDDDEGGKVFDGKDLAQGRGYNAFWIDPGSEFGLVKGEYRTSWIVDPVDGQIPYSAHGKELVEKFERQRNFDGPEGRPSAERCLIIGGRAGPPMINGLYNNNYQIFQSSDYVVIQVEMVRHARIIPLRRKHMEQSIPQLFGDSIGWWEGDTLVVETTDFHPLHADSMVNVSRKGKVTERFTRTSAKQIFYEFVVDDPVFYSKPWRGEMSFNSVKEQIYEYACHEGNYAMTGILAGARAQSGKAHATK